MEALYVRALKVMELPGFTSPNGSCDASLNVELEIFALDQNIMGHFEIIVICRYGPVGGCP